MKHSVMTALLAVAACALLLCVKGPVAIEEQPHVPRKAVPVTASDFNDRVTSSRIALIEFFSEKCAVCASLTWAIDSLHAVFGKKAFVGANNTDTDTLYKLFALSSVPTYIFFRDGKEAARRSFHKNEPWVYDTLSSLFNRFLADTLPSPYLTLDESTFDSVVLRKGTTAMVLFEYPFCSSCALMDSILQQLAPRFEGRAVVAKVYTTNNVLLCDRYGITGTPQILFFKDSVHREELRVRGVVDSDTLAAALERLIADPPRERVVLLGKNNFNDSVAVPGRVAMVDFFLPTCYACQAMSATVAEVADSFYGTALVAKVDCTLDDSLASAFGIRLVPTFVFMKGGVEYYRCTGNFSFDTLAAHIREGLESPGTGETP